jgi:hypothetical protein
MVKKQTKKELKKALALSRKDEASLTEKIADQKARNEQKIQELCAVRNNYPVLYVSAQIPLHLVGLI